MSSPCHRRRAPAIPWSASHCALSFPCPIFACSADSACDRASMSASLCPACCAASLAARWRSCSCCTASCSALSPACFRRELGRFLPQLLLDFRDLPRDRGAEHAEVGLQSLAARGELRHQLRDVLAPRLDDADRLLDLRDALLQIGGHGRRRGHRLLALGQRRHRGALVVAGALPFGEGMFRSTARCRRGPRAAPSPARRAHRSAR